MNILLFFFHDLVPSDLYLLHAASKQEIITVPSSSCEFGFY